jgi:DNA replication protein DnaC
VTALRPVPDPRDSAADASCPLQRCDGSGWLEDESGRARPCACLDRRKRAAATRSMGTGVPKRFRGVSFDRKPICDLDPMVLRHVRRYVEDIDGNLDAGRGLWFFGDVGTGKTSIAMLVAKAAEDAGRSVAIYPLTRLLAEIKGTYDRDSGDSYLALFRRLSVVDLLQLDDLGTERTTEWVLEQLYSIIDRRYNDQRSIVVTTNLEEPELYEQLGDRIVSRLTEICGDPLVLRGKDRRVELAPGPADLDESA